VSRLSYYVDKVLMPIDELNNRKMKPSKRSRIRNEEAAEQAVGRDGIQRSTTKMTTPTMLYL
jgi:hypothetical protein